MKNLSIIEQYFAMHKQIRKIHCLNTKIHLNGQISEFKKLNKIQVFNIGGFTKVFYQGKLVGEILPITYKHNLEIYSYKYKVL